MAYIGNQPAPSNVNSDSIQDGSIKNVDIATDAAIDISKLDNVTATNTEINKLDGVSATTADLNVVSGADAAGIDSTDIQKTQYLSGVTSDVQTQLDAASGSAVKGTLTKSFSANETSTIALSSASSPTPIVAVTKEVPQIGVSAKGNWDVRADGGNYEIEDTAPSVSITPSVADDDGVFTLGSGSFASTDVGKRVVGNGGEAVIKNTTGSYELVTAFNDTSTIASGDWEMYGLDFNEASGLKMAGFYQNSIEPGKVTDTNVIRQTRLPSYQDNAFAFNYNQATKTLWVWGRDPRGMIQKYTLDNDYDFTEARAWSTSVCGDGLSNYPTNLSFNHDGSKVFFIAGEDENFNNTWASGTNKVITQFDLLEDKYDIEYRSSEATSYFDNNEHNEFDTSCIKFSPDGTKYFIFGGTLATIQGFTASVTGEIRDSDSKITANVLDVSGQVAVSNNRTYNKFQFADNGLKIFFSDYSGGTVFRYDMTTAYDLSTASYVGSSGLFSSISDFHVKDDGTQIMYIQNGDYVYIRDLSTAYDLSTVSASVTNGLQFNNANNLPNTAHRDMCWSSDGNHLFTVEDSSNRIIRYDAAEIRNIKSLYFYMDNTEGTSTKAAKYSMKPSDIVSNVNGIQGIFLKPDGTKVYIADRDTDQILEFTMPTAYDLSSITASSGSIATGTNYFNPKALWVAEKGDGTGVVYYGVTSTDQSNPPYIVRHPLSTAWDLTSAGSGYGITLDDNGENLGEGEYGLVFNEAGTSFYRQSDLSVYDIEITQGDQSGKQYRYPIVQYSFTNGAYGTGVSLNEEVSHETRDYNLSADDALQSAGLNPFQFSPEGDRMFVSGNGTNAVWETKLDAAFSIANTRNRRVQSSFGYQSKTVTETTWQKGVEISNDGTKLFILESRHDNNSVLKRYTMSTPFDLDTLNSSPDQSYTVKSANNSRFVHGLKFDPTGTIVTMAFKNNNDSRWTVLKLSTPYDLTTVNTNTSPSYDLGQSVSYTPNNQTGEQHVINGFWFSADGSTFSAAVKNGTGTSVSVQQWRLNRPYDLSNNAVSTPGSGGSYPLYNATQDYWGGMELDYTRMIAYHTWAVSDWKNNSNYDNWTQDYRSPLEVLDWTSGVAPRPENQNPDYRGNWNIIGNRVHDMTLTKDGRYLFAVERDGNIRRITVAGEYLKDVTPHDQYFPAITNNTGQVDTSPWTDINSMTATETGQGEKLYAFSTDARTTFKVIHNTNGTRSIVRDNSGTWQYNSNATYGSETWTNATSNNQFAAFREAMAVAVNRMASDQLAAVTDANFFAAGDTFDLAIILKSTEGQLGAPTSDGISVNYDAEALNKGAILGTDYDYDVPSSTSVRITSLKSHNLKVKVL